MYHKFPVQSLYTNSSNCLPFSVRKLHFPKLRMLHQFLTATHLYFPELLLHLHMRLQILPSFLVYIQLVSDFLRLFLLPVFPDILHFICILLVPPQQPDTNERYPCKSSNRLPYPYSASGIFHTCLI